MKETPKFLRVVEPEPMAENALERLAMLVDRYQKLEASIKDVEIELVAKKALFQVISQEEIPTLLSMFGLSEIKLKDGRKVIVKQDASVSVPADKEDAFFAFLRERKEEDIIKLHFHFSRMHMEKMKALFTFLTMGEYDYSSERNVHSQTLKKYFKELLGIGVDAAEQARGVAEGRYLRKEAITDVANVFTFFHTKIK